MPDDAPYTSSIVLYQTEDGRTRIECRLDDGTIWLSQTQIADLFQTSVPNINLHLKAIYEEGELEEAATIKQYLIVRTEGPRNVTRKVLHYSLPAILAVGYRVRSFRGTQFRQWATARLSEYLVKGFTLDDERLKNPPGPGVPDYFDGTYLLEGAAVRKSDISVAKNYLRESEITELNRVVTMFLDFAEDQARRKKQTFIADWRDRLDDFLRFNDRNILPDLGRVTREQAEKRAEAEYERFSARRRSQREPEAEAQNLRDLEAQAGKLPRKKSRSK